jgi:purine-binding chemotaxis protein CheW
MMGTSKEGRAAKATKMMHHFALKVGNISFGVPLLEVKQVIEWQEPCPAGLMAEHCLGFLNIRGDIILVVDLRVRLGKEARADHRVILVTECESGLMGVVVDRIEGIVKFAPEEINTKVSRDFQLAEESYGGLVTHKDKVFAILSLVKLFKKDLELHHQGRMIA